MDSPFHKIINGTSQFVIPVFQRDYSWTEKQCGQLWADVVRVGRSESMFLVHATQEGETLHWMRSEAQLEPAMKLARQAFELAAQ